MSIRAGNVRPKIYRQGVSPAPTYFLREGFRLICLSIPWTKEQSGPSREGVAGSGVKAVTVVVVLLHYSSNTVLVCWRGGGKVQLQNREEVAETAGRLFY